MRSPTLIIVVAIGFLNASTANAADQDRPYKKPSADRDQLIQMVYKNCTTAAVSKEPKKEFLALIEGICKCRAPSYADTITSADVEYIKDHRKEPNDLELRVNAALAASGGCQPF